MPDARHFVTGVSNAKRSISLQIRHGIPGLDKNTNLKPPMQIEDGTAAAIGAVEVDTRRIAEGKVEYVNKYWFHDKLPGVVAPRGTAERPWLRCVRSLWSVES